MDKGLKPWVRKGLDVGVDERLCIWDGAMKIGKGEPVITNR